MPVSGKRRTKAEKLKFDRQSRWGQWYIIYLFVSILAGLFAPIPQFFIINHLASERGYVYCPPPLFSRHQPDTWALPGAHGRTERCPREGASASS